MTLPIDTIQTVTKASEYRWRTITRETYITELTKTRIAWIDNMKAIAIYLVVVGHYVYQPHNQSPGQAYIYSFHMHLFFLLAGLLFSHKDQGSLKEVVRRRIRTLAVPYFIFELLKYAFFLLRRQYGRTPDPNMSVLEPLYNIITLKASWFLGVLFVVSIAYHLLAPRIKGYKSFGLLGAICTGVHYVLATYCGDWVHVNLPRCFTAMVFFALGSVCRQWLLSEAPMSLVRRRPYVPAAVLGLNVVVFYYTYAAYRQTPIDINFSANYLSFYALSLSGIYLAYIACNVIPPNAVMRFVGANTILIYLMEAYPPAIVRRGMQHAFGIDMAATMNLGYACLYAAMSVAILSPVIILINKYAPWTVGRSPAVGSEFAPRSE
ncbi:MAG: acyltransferase family protein [Phycisphaerae bacterium]|nr:acyltransferase family protein [Phycisphaerae bacterium]